MIVLFGAEIRRLDAQGAGHAKVQAEPVWSGEFEQHLLAARGAAKEFCAGKPAFQTARIAAAENSFFRVEIDCGDTKTDTGVPSASIILHLSELWHRAT